MGGDGRTDKKMAKQVLSSGHNGDFGRDEICYTDGTSRLVGDLYDGETNESTRPATIREQIEADAAADEGGWIFVDGRRCFVD
jgi:hypothetical protein